MIVIDGKQLRQQNGYRALPVEKTARRKLKISAASDRLALTLKIVKTHLPSELREQVDNVLAEYWKSV